MAMADATAMVDEAAQTGEAKATKTTKATMSEFLRQKNPATLREALAALRMAYPRESIAQRINACVAWHEQRIAH